MGLLPFLGTPEGPRAREGDVKFCYKPPLLPQRQVLQDQFPMAAERQRECAGDDEE